MLTDCSLLRESEELLVSAFLLLLVAAVGCCCEVRAGFSFGRVLVGTVWQGSTEDTTARLDMCGEGS
jgi:hypothetical protein